jgi:riboflavin synthase
MFTGIIQRVLAVRAVEQRGSTRRIVLPNAWPDVRLGESIAINGVCLTVADIGQDQLFFDIISETVDRTNLAWLEAGDEVNIERSLRAGDRIDGHFVQGHVDGTGKLLRKIDTPDECRLTIQVLDQIAQFLAPKGSICVDGVSLTIAALGRGEFDVALIPTTLKLTTLGRREPGWQFNLEADILAKQIVHFLQSRQSGLSKSN